MQVLSGAMVGDVIVLRDCEAIVSRDFFISNWTGSQACTHTHTNHSHVVLTILLITISLLL